MSGGSYNYAYQHAERFAEALERSEKYWGEPLPEPNSPIRLAFAAHLRRVAAAMKAIEWVDSYDCSPPHDALAIIEALRGLLLTDEDIGLSIELLGGLCPVQGEGTVMGKPFYFRSRGQNWTFTIDQNPLADVVEFVRSGEYGEPPYGAGYMPLELATDIIRRCAYDYVLGIKRP